MTGLLLGLLLGLGLFLIWWSFWVPAPRGPRTAKRIGPLGRLSDEIVQAGFAGLSVRTLLASCVIAFVLVLAFVQAAVGVLPIAACFAVMASFIPIAAGAQARSRAPGQAAGPVAGCRRQHHVRGAGRHGAARGTVPAGNSWS